jgi:hypothetical protein
VGAAGPLGNGLDAHPLLALQTVSAGGQAFAMETLHVDCGRCTVRGRACSDCVISVLLGTPSDRPVSVDLVEEEQAALAALAESGLVPPLRLVERPAATEFERPPLLGGVRQRIAERADGASSGLGVRCAGAIAGHRFVT